MAYERNPDDPYRESMAADEMRRPAPLESDLQIDPELAEGRAGGGRMAMYAVAIAVVLGAVFYGLNNTSTNPAGTGSSTATQTAPVNQDTAQTSSPAVPPGVRDVTPRNNMEPGTTTGAAPARPQRPEPTSPATDANSPSPGAAGSANPAK